MTQAGTWQEFYSERRSDVGRYPTEWVVRTIAGGNYPELKMDKSRYQGARILDMGCGDGRNLPLLIALGFEVHATEINLEMVETIKSYAQSQGWPVNFKVGLNHRLPYPHEFFDYMLCCASSYYLDGPVTWPQVRTELTRVLKPGGILVANFCDEDNAVLKEAVRQEDGSLLITSDPFKLRNGSRFMAVAKRAELEPLLGPEFRLLAAGHQNDDFYGLRVSGYITVSERL